MTNPHNTTDTDQHTGSGPDGNSAPPPTVEDEWARILRKHAADPPEESTTTDQIQRILRALQTHPALALGAPTRDQIDSLTTTAIDQLDLVANGPADDAQEADQLAAELTQALQAGLSGDLVGPHSLMEPHELQATPDRISPPEEGEPPNSGSGQHPAAHPQMANDNTDDTDTDDSSNEHQNADTPGDADNGLDVEPAELNPQADANPEAGNQPGAAGAAQPDPEEPAGDDQPIPEDLDVDLRQFMASQAVGMVAEEEGLSESQQHIAYTAAMVSLGNYQEFLRDHLFNSVDENAREIVFDSAVVEPIEDDIRQMIQEQQP